MNARLARGFGLVAVLLAALARSGAAQTHECATSSDSIAAATRWPPPLDRVLSLRASNVSLRDALDRVAALARIRLSYSAEALPLDRRVCAAADSTPAGRVLELLLSGTSTVPVAAGGDQVVLAPRPSAPAREQSPAAARPVNVLDRVVVTGSAAGAPERELTVGVDVLGGRRLERENANTISSALDGYVPGVWSWTQSPSNLLSSYASIRGASSFGLSYPKIYIDGIEVANPLLLSRFNAASIDRIEVIRGPQGSALYGTDAISGVINIVTRHEGAVGDGTHAELRTEAGVSQTSFSHDVLTQDHAVAVRTGTSTRSADLHVEAGSMGAYVPDGSSRQLMATGAARTVSARGSLSGTARLYVEQAGAGNSPLARATISDDSIGTSSSAKSPQSVTEYTLGTTATLFGGGDGRWTHTFVAGADGYRLANVQTNYTPIPSAVDSALRAAQGGADRGTVRASSVLRLRGDASTRATLTLSAEHAMLRVNSLAGPASLEGPHMPPASVSPDRRITTWQNSTGLSTQLNVALDDLFFATGGVRVERDSRLAANDRVATLPMLGLASVGALGPLSFKVRAAYGKGIRPPATVSRSQLLQPGAMAVQATLGPEVQSGTEIGLDVALERAFTLQLTRFDQRASGLIQQVALPADSGTLARRMTYTAQNVGEISNAGWELEATSGWSHASVTGALTFVDSRVRKLAAGYLGDLVVGDRMLQVPAQTASLNVAWTASDWSAALTGSRAFDWINYDELALAQAWASNPHPLHQLFGARLRQYWRRYDGGLHVRATASRSIRSDLALELSVDNLLNYQRGEPDNITIVPGRTILTGVRIKF